MELSVSGCLVLTLSLVSATPYGYGAKSGAVARAEASAGAGSFDALPLSPLTVPGNSGFSGSYSTSSSSSFASSSASASSSSFSYSGAGAGVVPGFGKKLGCEGGCQNGVNNDFGPSGQVTNSNGIGAHNFAGASATAGAVANFPIQRCHGSNCFVTSDKKCTSSDCKELGNNANRNVESNGNFASDSNGDESHDFSVKRPHLTDMEKNKKEDKLYINSGLQTSPVVPFDKKVNNVNVENCEGPTCGTSLPLTPHGSNDNNFNNGPYQEQACATHDCKIGGTNQRKPSSYNVPILGPQANIEKKKTICTSGNCQDAEHVENDNYDDKTLQISNVNKPSTMIQLPAGPSDEVALCNSKDCHNQSYQQNPSAGFNIGPINKIPFSNTDGHIPKPSYNSNAKLHGVGQNQNQHSFGSNKPVSPSTASGPTFAPNIPSEPFNQLNVGINHSYYPNKPSEFDDNPRRSQTFGNNPLGETTGAQGSSINTLQHSSLNSATHPTVSAINDKTPYIEPVNSYQNPISKPSGISFDSSSSSISGTAINPSSQLTGGASNNTPHKNCISGNCAYSPNPSYNEGRPSTTEINGPTGSDSDVICALGSCASGTQLGQPVSNKPLNINSNIQPPYYPHQSPSSNTFACTAQNCQSSFGNENRPNIKPTFPESSAMEKLNPSNTGSEVLLSNHGNKIYSGGFGGPVGILSENSNGKPSSGIFIKPDSGANHNTPHNVVSSQLPHGPNSIQSVPAHSHQIATQVQQPVNINEFNRPGASVPTVTNIKPEENKRRYTGGFGGPAGLLKPNEYMIPPTIPKVGCSSGDCNPSQGTQNGLSGALAVSHTGTNAAATANANAVSFSGTFGGPPGLLKPYDEGKLDQNGKNFLGKHGNDFVNSEPDQIQPHSNGVSDSHTNAVASASAVAGSYGHPGGCNTGCPSKGANQNQSGALGHSNGVQHDMNQASATASAKSAAGSYAHGRNIATASAHASAAASAKGAWR